MLTIIHSPYVDLSRRNGKSNSKAWECPRPENHWHLLVVDGRSQYSEGNGVECGGQEEGVPPAQVGQGEAGQEAAGQGTQRGEAGWNDNEL